MRTAGWSRWLGSFHCRFSTLSVPIPIACRSALVFLKTSTKSRYWDGICTPSSVNCHPSVGMISDLQTRTDSYGSESAPSVLAKQMKERMEAVEGKIHEPGWERFAATGPSPVVHVLASCLSEQVAVIQGSPADPLLLLLPPLLPARPFRIDQGLYHLGFPRWRLPTLLMLPPDWFPHQFVWRGLEQPL